MGLFDVEKSKLAEEIKQRGREVIQASEEAERLRKRLEKLEKVQDWEEPMPGTVLRFSRSVAGSVRKYTFVATRIAGGSKDWYITGSDNSLKPLHLSNKGNAWADILLAIGDAKVKVATTWAEPNKVGYRYFESPLAQWKFPPGGPTQYRRRGSTLFGDSEWIKAPHVTLDELVQAANDPRNSVNEVSKLTGED
jgi:hypothetical protein